MVDNLFKVLKNADILVFEGFEMTGKSTLLSKSKEFLDSLGADTVHYRPNWEECLTDDVVSRGNRYIPGLSVVEFFRELNDYNKILLLDRWVAVSYVYQRMYNQSNDLKNSEVLIDAAKKCSGNQGLVFIHKYHSSKEEARRMYEISMNDSDHDDIYDKFKNFEEYWSKYLDFEELYDEFYRISGFPVVKVSSYYNKIGEIQC